MILALANLYVWWYVDTAIYREIKDSHPLIAGLSMVLGFTAFDVQGILLGPVLVCIPVIVCSYYLNQLISCRRINTIRFLYSRMSNLKSIFVAKFVNICVTQRFYFRSSQNGATLLTR